MVRISVADAERDFAKLIERVSSQRESIELSRGDMVVACLSPGPSRSKLKVRDLNAFLQSLPTLGDDAAAFIEDVDAIRRSLPTEANPWD